MKLLRLLVLVFLGAASSAKAQTPAAAAPLAKAQPLSLLGAGEHGRVVMDYLGYDEATDTVWAPGGNTGKVFVLDAQTHQLRSADGFPVAESNGRSMGPSSVTFGPGSAFIGNRADSTVCAVSTATLKRGRCIKLASSPDGLAYVASTHEVWATTPRKNSISLLSVTPAGLVDAGTIELAGEPEGYAVDAKRGRFFTNLEDKDQTVAIDVSTHQVLSTWKTGCGEKGPRGLALDSGRGLLFVACTSGFVALAIDRDGAQVGNFVSGGGVDNPGIAVPLQRLFAAAGAAGVLSVVDYDPSGALHLRSAVQTAPGVRVVVSDKRGQAFAADSAGGQLWVSGP